MGIWIYAGCLALGGVLLLASLLGGGHGDADGGADHGHDDAHGHGEDTSAFVAALTSLRFWTFFLTFLGLVGVVFTGFGLASGAVTVVAAVGTGALIGIGVAVTLRKIGGSPDSAARSGDYIGKSARVLVPVTKTSLGKVRVQIKGSTVDLLATTDDDGDLVASEEVLVVEMEGTRAKVSRVKDA